MRSVSRTALVPHSADRMYSLVYDVEAYPDFLPWCSGAKVLERDAEHVVATLEMHRAGLRKSFTTRNTLRPGEAIDLELVGGPFRELRGGWRFEPLGEAGCKVTLALEFEFDSRALDALLGTFFKETLNSLVDAFTQRADQVYGGR